MDDLPRTLYHGTPTAYIPSILKDGLKAGTVKRANFPGFKEDTTGVVFLAEKEGDARFFGLAATMEYFERKGLKGPDKMDFTIFVVDSLKVQMYGTPIVEPIGKLDPKAFRGRQFMAVGDVDRKALVAAKRVYKGKKKIEEEIAYL